MVTTPLQGSGDNLPSTVVRGYLRRSRSTYMPLGSLGRLIDVDLIIASEDVFAALPEATEPEWGRLAGRDPLGLVILARMTT